jgi:hypothetical protein
VFCMNCQAFENCILDLARSQLSDAGRREEAMAHATVCAACAEKLESQNTLTSDLRALAAEPSLIASTADFEETLRTAFRQEVSTPRGHSVAYRARYAAVAAAVIFALVALGVIRAIKTPSPDQPIHHASSLTVKPLPVSSAAGGVASSSPTDNLDKRTTVRRVKPRPEKNSVSVRYEGTSVVASLQPQVTTAFMPLVHNSAANLQDGAQMVKVEMPRYAMARFGLPVNMDRYDETVTADVWVGTDGLARAIRFVQ